MADPVVLTVAFITQKLNELFPAPDESNVKEVVEKSMELANDENYVWMLSEDPERFKAAVGSLLVYYQDDQGLCAAIHKEMRGLQAISEMMEGRDVDLTREFGDDFRPIGLLKRYRQAKDARA